jgi:hypothetical protein
MSRTNSSIVPGFCPMGCGATLILTVGGQLICNGDDCLNSFAAAEILGDPETEHVVEISETDFTILHPLRERLDNALLACELHSFLAQLDEPPVEPGSYHATGSGSSWALQPIGKPTPAPVFRHAAYGVEITVLGEDAEYIAARGHPTDMRFTAAANWLARNVQGMVNAAGDRDGTFEDFADDIIRVWAIAVPPDPDCEWAVKWAGVTEHTTGAFPLTVWEA